MTASALSEPTKATLYASHNPGCIELYFDANLHEIGEEHFAVTSQQLQDRDNPFNGDTDTQTLRVILASAVESGPFSHMVVFPDRVVLTARGGNTDGVVKYLATALRDIDVVLEEAA
jgi:hypothetical protein